MGGVRYTTSMVVSTSAGALQSFRVNVTKIVPGSIVVDLLFTAPASASSGQLANLTAAVVLNGTKFFATQQFSARYGTPVVSGTHVEPAPAAPLNTVSTIATGVGVGVGGALLLGCIFGCVYMHRRAKHSVRPQPIVVGVGSRRRH